MNVRKPHYLLFSRVSREHDSGGWRFLLRTIDGLQEFEANDIEPHVRGERLDLLTIVRALESLDQPSRVTLVGCTSYVRQGVQYGLAEWRTNGWRWESFGEMVPVKNYDLWQRMDRALRFHQVDCRRWRFDPAHPPPAALGAPEFRVADAEQSRQTDEAVVGVVWRRRWRHPPRFWLPRWRRLTAVCRLWRRRLFRVYNILGPCLRVAT